MAEYLFPSSFRCDCGHEIHFFENTIREMKEMSAKRRKPQILGDDYDHSVEFLGGQPIAVKCPKKGRCLIQDLHASKEPRPKRKQKVEPIGNDVLVYAKVRDPEAKAALLSLLVNLPGERISSTLYEVFTADWDKGLWEDEVERMQSLINPATDTLIFWQAVAGKLARTCVAGRGNN